MPFHKIENFLHVLFSERREDEMFEKLIEKAAVKWCTDNKIESTPFNIITALYSLGYIRKHPLTIDEDESGNMTYYYNRMISKDDKEQFEKEYLGSWYTQQKEQLQNDLLRVLSKMNFTCAKEAIEAHGNTEKTIDWYKRWMPEYYKKYGLPTTVQYSLSCILMDHALKIITDRC